MNRLVYKQGYKYQVHDTFHYATGIVGFLIDIGPLLTLTHNGVITIRKGYAWDGASGPAIDTTTFMRGSLVHDALYQMIEEGLLPFSYRKRADDVLVEICKEDGMWAARRWWVKFAVNTFGARALETCNPVLFAPEKP